VAVNVQTVVFWTVISTILEADNNSSEEHAASIFRIQVILKSLKMDVSCPPAILETISKTILHHRPDNHHQNISHI